MDCSLLGSSVYRISQARIGVDCQFHLQGSSQPRDWNHVSHIGRWILCHWATGKPFTIAWVKYFLKIIHVLALFLCSPKHSCGILNAFILDINKLGTLQGNLSSSLGLDTKVVLCVILSKCTLYLLTISYFKVSESYSNWSLYWELWVLSIHKHHYLPKFTFLYMILTLSGKLERHHSVSLKIIIFLKLQRMCLLWKKTYLCCVFISPRAIKHCVLVLYQKCLHSMILFI